MNLRRLRVPPADPPTVTEQVTVLIPARNEARRVGPCVRSVLAQSSVPGMRVLVLDDESDDGTAEVVKGATDGDPRVELRAGTPVPRGWWGKTWACHQLAVAAPSATVLVFVDADVVLAPHAIASAVSLLRWTGLDLVSPYPCQLTGSVAERLVQPLLQWSWLTTLPLRLAERSSRPSLAAANGAFLVVDRAAYERSGGHSAVRDRILEDIELIRAVKRAGGRGGVIDGTALASCRMYEGWRALHDGYVKSLWAAFGSPARAAGVVGLLGLAYLVPPVAALRGSRVGLAGYLAAVAGRAAVARRTGGRLWPDCLAHPGSVVVFGWLVARSWQLRRTGQLTVSGRPLP